MIPKQRHFVVILPFYCTLAIHYAKKKTASHNSLLQPSAEDEPFSK